MFGFNKAPEPGPVPGTPDSTPNPSSNPNPSPDPSPTSTPNTIPEKMDLDFFNKLVDPATPQAPGKPLSVSNDILTPENLQKISETQNFSNSIPPETLQKLQNGDQAATMEAVEHIARAAHAAALSQTGAIIDAVIARQGSNLESKIKQDVESSINLRDITSNVPNIDQPVVRAGFEMISSQFREKFPQASPDQIRTMAQQYFTELSSAINPASPTPQQQQKAKEDSQVDWLSYAGFAPPPST